MKIYRSFKEFWPFYVGEHRLKLTRRFHFVGTLIVIVLVILSFRFSAYLLLAVPIAGYGFAWYAHFFIEKNRPATFTYPLWSLIGDLHMTGLFLSGRLGAELDRFGLR